MDFNPQISSLRFQSSYKKTQLSADTLKSIEKDEIGYELNDTALQENDGQLKHHGVPSESIVRKLLGQW